MSRLTALWRRLFVPAAAAPDVVPFPHFAPLPESHGREQTVATTVPPLHRAGFPVAICWSAKAGCTTVLKWFLHQTGLLDAALALNPWVHRYRTCVLMEPLADYVATCVAALRGGDVEVIKVVRDPARRAVSSYLHLVRMEPRSRWNPGVGEWKRSVGLGRQPGLAFEQFLHFVIDMQASGRPLDVHFQPQVLPTWDALVDRVIPLEHLADELAAVEARHGLPRTDLRRFSDSPHHTVPDHHHRWPGDVASFAATDRDLVTLGIPPTDAFLDDRTAELVRVAYARDYEAYGSLYARRPRQAIRRAA